MPKVSFYLRNDDTELWKRVEKKTEFIHDALNISRFSKRGEYPATVMSVDATRGTSVATIKPTKEFCKHGYSLEARMCKLGCR